MRDFKKLCNWDEIVQSLQYLTEEICNLPFKSNLATFGKFKEKKPTFDFSDSTNQYSIFVSGVFYRTNSIEDRPNFLLKKLVFHHIFHYCVYTILSGQSLLILSKQSFNEAISLAERMQIFIPFFQPQHSRIDLNIDLSECFKYSLSVAQETYGKSDIQISILDLDNKIYIGEGCPKNSFVQKKMGKGSDQSERVFLLLQHHQLKTISNQFLTKLAEYQKKEKFTFEKMMFEMAQIGFSKDDFPILNYLIHSYFNQQKCRPILMNNNISRTGKIIAPFY
ncbi:hypothetical protein TRFO_24732 [Tritrichomonas foetus]|uniref:Uncharacterized protein n=1 Tax=Tritrichomonas foetus TaxID=1144522 RepID=A0A1J4K6D4_9EUKA|nr:hypothetical protein TRFO_24732 [Tritrichomonas foetus]|eukprot:OHT07017.1 hypothetical protein TRFO_24732 [Tritrichomonas foetus]